MKANCLLIHLALTLALLAGASASATSGSPTVPHAAPEGLDYGPPVGLPNYAELDHLLRGQSAAVQGREDVVL